jgi:3-oxoacyl-[acyl-carrier protein] reductase
MTMCRGKTALVTNASRNEGHAAAIALADAGAQVLVHDDRATRRIARTVRLIQANGGVARAITTDTTAPDGPDSLAQQTRLIVGDRLDILVFNTASTRTPSNQSMAATFDAQIAARARAPFLLVQQLVPILSRGSLASYSLVDTTRRSTTLVPATSLPSTQRLGSPSTSRRCYGPPASE